MVDEPSRLIDDSAEAEGLRTDLARAAQDDVDYDVAAGVAVFEASIAGVPPGAPAATTGGALSGKTLLVLLGVVALGGVAAAVLLGPRDGSTPPAVAAQSPQQTQPDPRPALVPDRDPRTAPPAPVAEVPTAERPEPTVVPPSPPQAATQLRTRAKAKPARQEPRPAVDPPAVAQDRLKAEMAAMNRARAALAADPTRALSLLREADLDFRDGLFVEQRAGLAVLAQFGAGDDADARTAAQRYLKRYPRGTYADKVRDRLAR